MKEIDYKKALYRRNNFGQPCIWYCTNINTNDIVIYHGILGKSISKEIVKTKRNNKDEINSRIKAKRKTGYKYLDELKDNVISPVEGLNELLAYLNTYLPDYRTTEDGTLLPMLAKTYDNKDNKLFNKCPVFIGQYKINGLRCFISAEPNFGDMFKPVKLNFQSREGTYWKSLYNLEEYIINTISAELLSKMIYEHYILDGELYLPNHTVNEINHFVKDPNCEENKLIQYWCYDIAIENCFQHSRIEYLKNTMKKNVKQFFNKEEHFNNKERFVILDNYDVCNETDSVTFRNNFINIGFEGLILRNPNVEYQFGKRNLSMIKYKKSTDGKFKIINIYAEGINRPTIPLFLCRNDINDALFECHVGGTFEYQESVLKNKEKYIGKYMYVEYGERSGVNQVPFHIKTTYIINE